MNVIEFAVAETLKANPYLTKEDVALFTNYIENALPQIAKDMDLPNVDIIKRMEEEKLKRIKRVRRETEVRKVEKKLRFIDALYKLKGLSNGNGSFSSTVTPMVSFGAWPSAKIAIPIPILSDTSLEKVGNGKYQDNTDIEFPLEVASKEPEFLGRSEGTIVKGVGVPLFLERITEDMEVLRKKNTDENFGKIIDEIKSSIEKLPELHDEYYHTEIVLRRDIELPGWEQTIIKFKIENKSFDEKMKLWDEIDGRLREVIKTFRDEAIKKGVDPVEIDKINRNLFVDVELV